MNKLRRFWLHLQGQNCKTCRFSDTFRSSGDGQVSRLHTYCRNPDSSYHDRPAPSDLWCDAWQRVDPDQPDPKG